MNSTAVNSGKTGKNRKLANNINDTVPTVSFLLPGSRPLQQGVAGGRLRIAPLLADIESS